MLVGRDAERAAVVAAIEAEEPIVVTGEAGVGKTALVEQAAADAGRRLVAGGALATLRHLPLLAVERAVGRAFGRADALAAASALEGAVKGDVALLDDLQWAHPATLDVAMLASGRFALVAVVRTGDDDGRRTVKTLADVGFREMPIAGLDDDAAAEVVRSRRTGSSAAEVSKVVRAGGGNPLLLRELASAEGLPSDLGLAVAERLARLDEPARHALACLALARRPLPIGDLGIALDDLREAELVVVGPDGARVRHGLLADALIGRLSPPARRAATRDLARLERHPGDRASHLAELGDNADACIQAARARDEAPTPGERAHWAAVVIGFSPAAERDPDAVLDAVREVAPRDPAEARRLLDSIHDEASDARVDPVHDAAARAMRAVLDVHQTMDVAAATASLEQAVSVLRGSATPWEAMAVTDLATLRMMTDVSAGIAAAEEALALAQRIGHGVERARSALANALLAVQHDGWEPLFAEVIADTLAEGNLATAGRAARLTAIGMRLSRRPDDALDLCRRIGAEADDAGFLAVSLDLQVEALECLVALGRFAEAAEAGAELLELPVPVALRRQVVAVHGKTLALLGHRDEAARVLVELVGNGGHAGFSVGDADEVALTRWLADDAAGAARLLAEHATDDPQLLDVVASPIVAGWVADDLGSPRTDLVVREGLASAGGAEPAEVAALVFLATEPAAAVDRFLEAAERWRGLQVDDELRCRWAAGEAARRAGRADAIDLLEQAQAACLSFGAVALADRCRRSLVLGGGRSAPPATDDASRGRASTPPLTRRESEALRLVSSGGTSAEIADELGVSRRTVDSFVASAMRKLGAATRAEAAARITQR